jgi:crotonobetainyl-CoA:carnitine CoA-transferase CaiB-like acyl-CoA transferase
VFEGFRVLELGTFVMVPSAATVLADFGADVIKVEHPITGDPARGRVGGNAGAKQGEVSLFVEQTNRGKRSVGLDIAVPEAREALYKLASTCDVFMTSFLPPARQKYRIDVEHIREHNPRIIYASADAVGVKGPESGKPGFDFSVFWARSGFQSAVTGPGDKPPVGPRPGFGDKTSAMNLAFGVAAALLRRERTGEPAVIDVSLLGSALWSNSSDVAYSAGMGSDFSARPAPRSPTGTAYRTADGRWIQLTMPDADRWWPDLCRHLGRDDLLADERFGTNAGRSANAEVCVAEMAKTFESATLAEWRERFVTLRAPWEAVQNPYEVASDPQVVANGYIADVKHPSGQVVSLVRPPVQFDGVPPELGSAPDIAEHTDEVLLEAGYSADDLARLRASGALG